MVRQPTDDWLRAKLQDGAKPFSQWPFEPRSAIRVKLEASPTAPPPNLPPPFLAPRAGALSERGVELTWEESEAAAGYELEVRRVDALGGPGEWYQAHRGRHGSHFVACGRAVAAVKARVRAYNAARPMQVMMPPHPP